jgi:cytochrome c-type biogenesis protein CcmE
MKIPANTMRIAIACVIIVGTVAWLAFSGYNVGANKSYYVTIAELGALGEKAYHNQIRVEGFVVPGSIEQSGPHVTFTLNEFESHSAKAPTGKLLKVTYAGSEPPPDTFKDDSQALAEGSYGRDGVFHANALQAKCASKYAPATPLHPGETKPGAAPAKSTASSAGANATASGVPAS